LEIWTQSAISKYETGELAITFEAERKLKLIAFDFVLLKVI
jgi:hypothetical protein